MSRRLLLLLSLGLAGPAAAQDAEAQREAEEPEGYVDCDGSRYRVLEPGRYVVKVVKAQRGKKEELSLCVEGEGRRLAEPCRAYAAWGKPWTWELDAGHLIALKTRTASQGTSFPASNLCSGKTRRMAFFDRDDTTDELLVIVDLQKP